MSMGTAGATRELRAPVAPVAPVAPPAVPLPPARLHVVAWVDPVLDAAGVDLRSSYVERYWLPVLGPSATWLLRRLADGLDRAPDGFDVDLADLAASLGVGGPDSRHAPIHRALRRCARFGLVRPLGGELLALRRAAGRVPERNLARLPPPLRAAHLQEVAAWSGVRAASSGPVAPEPAPTEPS